MFKEYYNQLFWLGSKLNFSLKCYFNIEKSNTVEYRYVYYY